MIHRELGVESVLDTCMRWDEGATWVCGLMYITTCR